MKKTVLLIFLGLLIKNTIAQKSDFLQKYTSINLGAAYSLRPALTKINTPGNLKSTPVYCIGIQQRISNKISYGIGFSYLRISLSSTNVSQGIQTYINTIYYPNVSFKYHNTSIKGFDIYLEPKLVYKYTDLKFNLTYNGLNNNINSTVNIPFNRDNSFNIQFCLGGDIKLNKTIALNIEGGLGLPYFIRMGTVFNFGNTNNDESEDKKQKHTNPKRNNDDFANPRNRTNLYR
jgi:hypothetical protein